MGIRVWRLPLAFLSLLIPYFSLLMNNLVLPSRVGFEIFFCFIGD